MSPDADRAWIVGLGNPGRRYESSRHNVGFWVADTFVRDSGLDFGASRRKFRAEYREARLPDSRRFGSVVAVKPETYMNLSGEAVRDLLGYYQVPRNSDLSDRLMVVYDDLDLPLGRWRFRARGSAGGHRGVASVISGLGHDRFARLKIGIGRPSEGMESADYVLARLSEPERRELERIAAEAARCCPFGSNTVLRPA